MCQIINDCVLRYLNYVAQFSGFDLYDPSVYNWINPTRKQICIFEQLYCEIVDQHTGKLLHPDLTVLRCDRVRWVSNCDVELSFIVEGLNCFVILPFRLFYNIICGVQISRFDEPILFIARYRFDMMDSIEGVHDIPLFIHCRENFYKHEILSWFTEAELDALIKPNADEKIAQAKLGELNNILYQMPPELVDMIADYL